MGKASQLTPEVEECLVLLFEPLSPEEVTEIFLVAPIDYEVFALGEALELLLNDI